MNKLKVKTKRALLSVSDKTGIVELAQKLVAQNVEIISTGGTCKLLRENNIEVIEASQVTQFPEMMDGRVKTLHPKIHGGILGLRDEHKDQAQEHGINWIDLVVCNLYPFAKTIAKENVEFDEAIENIDIGGPSMVRSAAKNMGWVTVVVDPADYELVVDEIDFTTRKTLATKAFQHTAHYDAMISGYLAWIPGQARDDEGCDHGEAGNLSHCHPGENQDPEKTKKSFPQEYTKGFDKMMDLRYGENPHQQAAVYIDHTIKTPNVLNAKQHQGKQLSYNNIADSDAALKCLSEFDGPACVVVKHANPCGVATASNINDAFDLAFNADSKSAFGGIFALNETVDEALALKMTEIFFEIVLAPSFTKEALAILSKKPNLRVLQLIAKPQIQTAEQFRSVQGGLLVQQTDSSIITENDIEIVTKRRPTNNEMQSMLFGWKVLKHVKSNGILIAKDQVTIGVGAGQVSRIDAVELAVKKSAQEQFSGAVLASDAFFPFRDSIDFIATTGIKAIIQPSGAKRQAEVIAACDELGIAMVLTDKRCFYH